MFGPRACEREPEVAPAVAAGRATSEQQAHATACPACGQAAVLAAWMQQMADTSHEPHRLPDPNVIWLKAQLVRRWQAADEVAAPVERMERIELVVALAAVVALLVWQGPKLLRGLFSDALFGQVLSASRLAESVVSPPLFPVLPLVAVVLGLLTMVAVHRAVLSD